MNKNNYNELEAQERIYRDNKVESKKSRIPYRRIKSTNWKNLVEDFDTSYYTDDTKDLEELEEYYETK
jgi:hypothetical protein